MASLKPGKKWPQIWVLVEIRCQACNGGESAERCTGWVLSGCFFVSLLVLWKECCKSQLFF